MELSRDHRGGDVDDQSAVPPPSSRVAVTFTLAAVAVLCVLSQRMPGPASQEPFAAASQPTALVRRNEQPVPRVVEPGFCENQTWPYIDQRCLTRAKDDVSAEQREHQDISVPAADHNETPSHDEPSSSPVQNTAAALPSEAHTTLNTAAVSEASASGIPSQTPDKWATAAPDDHPGRPETRRRAHYHHRRMFLGFRF
jgi:hypothetical protein